MYKKFIFLISFVLILGLADSLFAATVMWDNEDANNFWKHALNWDSDALPVDGKKGDTVKITLTDANLCLIDDGTAAEAKIVRVGLITMKSGVPVPAESGAGELKMTGGTLDTYGLIEVGKKYVGTFDMQGGAVTSGKEMTIGLDPNGVGTLTMTGGTITTVGAGLDIGQDGGTGDVNMVDGTINVGPDGDNSKSMNIGRGRTKVGDVNIPGTGTFTMHAGHVDVSGTLNVGRSYADGTLYMKGGTIDVGPAPLDPTKEMRIGYQNGATGLVVMSDGTINVSGNLVVGAQSDSVGTLTMSGGTINLVNDLRIGRRDANGFVSISGGTIDVGGDLYVGSTFTPSDINLPPVPGTGLLTMTGGLISVADSNTIYVGTDGSTGLLELFGGQLEGGDLVIGPPGSGGILNIGDHLTGLSGILVLDGDKMREVLALIDAGLLICFNGDPTTYFQYDFDIRNPGKTTVTAVPEPATVALLGLGGLFLLRRRKR